MHLNDDILDKNFSEMIKIMVRSGDPVLVKNFLKCLLTPSEAADIAARWALVKSLDKKIPQREIARQLGLSLCKITRGSRELKKPDSAFQKMLALKRKLRIDLKTEI
ncbi:MAG: trp operon repressor [Treponema sp.]|jgi:TrpR family trp operon transcriptional repressor|nr:trp operon repressor [Treponema sp.]